MVTCWHHDEFLANPYQATIMDTSQIFDQAFFRKVKRGQTMTNRCSMTAWLAIEQSTFSKIFGNIATASLKPIFPRTHHLVPDFPEWWIPGLSKDLSPLSWTSSHVFHPFPFTWCLHTHMDFFESHKWSLILFHNLFCQSRKNLWIYLREKKPVITFCYRQQSGVQKQAARRTVATSMVFRTTSTNSLRAFAIIGSGNVATSWDLQMFYQSYSGTHQNDIEMIIISCGQKMIKKQTERLGNATGKWFWAAGRIP